MNRALGWVLAVIFMGFAILIALPIMIQLGHPLIAPAVPIILWMANALGAFGSFMTYAIPVILFIIGLVLVFRKINGGWWMVSASILAFFLGPLVIKDIGSNIGMSLRDLTGQATQPNPGTPPSNQPAGRTGETKAPTTGWSSWVNVLDVECVYWQGEDPSGNRFTVEYVKPNGDKAIYDGTPLQQMRGVRFRSTTNAEEKVLYRIVDKQNGQC